MCILQHLDHAAFSVISIVNVIECCVAITPNLRYPSDQDSDNHKKQDRYLLVLVVITQSDICTHTQTLHK